MKKIVHTIDEAWGKKKIVLKSDNEAAIKELRSKVRSTRTEEAMIESPSPHDSKANGSIERGVREIEGIVRTWVPVMEEKYKAEIPTNHKTISYLMGYAGKPITDVGDPEMTG